MQQIEPNNLFDLSDLSDLDAQVRSQININSGNLQTSDMMLICFQKQNILTINEIIVSLYRLFKAHVTRALIRQTVHVLKKKNKITQVRRGVYEYCGN